MFKATDANLKNITYSVDGGAKKPLTSGVGIKMGLTPGNHTILAEALDYFRLDADSSFQRTITGTINNAPTISIKSPSEGQKYSTDIVTLQYDITDKENDPITASYNINGGTKVATEKSVNKQLQLQNGLYKILIKYADPTHTSKDSLSFEMNKPTAIEPVTIDDKVILYPNPVREILNIEYESNTPKIIYREIYNLEGKK
jgi:hypothetical protein